MCSQLTLIGGGLILKRGKRGLFSEVVERELLCDSG